MSNLCNISLGVSLGLALLSPTIISSTTTNNITENDSNIISNVEILNDENIQQRLFTTLAIDIYPVENELGQIQAVVNNTFTLFPSTVTVTLYVFTSPTYTTDITQMKQEGYAYTYDLDMGNVLSVKVSTNGEKKYWMAYMNYQVNRGEMQNGRSEVKLFNADGSIPPY